MKCISHNIKGCSDDIKYPLKMVLCTSWKVKIASKISFQSYLLKVFLFGCQEFDIWLRVMAITIRLSTAFNMFELAIK